MIVFLTLIYVVVLFVLVKMKVLPNTKATWLSTIVWVVVLFIFLFIPMQWGAPSGPTRIVSRAVQVVPNVTGQVVSVSVEPNRPIAKNDVLFQIDPEPFELAVALAEASLVRVETQAQQDQDALDSARAQLRQAEASKFLAQRRFDDDKKLVESGTVAPTRMERREADLEAAISAVEQAEAAVSRAETEIGAVTKDGVIAKVAEAEANLELAVWNLEQSTVRAPSNGYVTNLALAEGQRVTNLPFAPSMVFVDTSEKIIGVEIHQIYLRHVRVGQPVEIAFKTTPGLVVTGTVESVFGIASQGQALVTGTVLQAGQTVAEPFFVRLRLDNDEDLAGLNPGTAGTAAIYTESVAATHVIRKVMIRMEAILNYLNPAL